MANDTNNTKPAPALTAAAGSVVYLSGAISSDPEFKAKFDFWGRRLLAAGAKRVLNPAQLPAGWEYGEYMEHCLVMVRRATLLVMLPCWRQSPGARAEKAYAESLKVPVIDLSQNVEVRRAYGVASTALLEITRAIPSSGTFSLSRKLGS